MALPLLSLSIPMVEAFWTIYSVSQFLFKLKPTSYLLIAVLALTCGTFVKCKMIHFLAKPRETLESVRLKATLRQSTFLPEGSRRKYATQGPCLEPNVETHKGICSCRHSFVARSVRRILRCTVAMFRSTATPFKGCKSFLTFPNLTYSNFIM